MFDVEGIIEGIIEVYQAELNAKIASVDAQKDTPLMKEIPQDGYTTDLNESVSNFDPFVIVSEVSNDVESQGQSSSETVTISVVVIAEDSGETPMYRTMLRYRRCLKEVANDNWKKLHNELRFKLKSLSPIALTNLDSSANYKAIGIVLETSFNN